jgi:hypothetical protein
MYNLYVDNWTIDQQMYAIHKIKIYQHKPLTNKTMLTHIILVLNLPKEVKE